MHSLRIHLNRAQVHAEPSQEKEKVVEVKICRPVMAGVGVQGNQHPPLRDEHARRLHVPSPEKTRVVEPEKWEGRGERGEGGGRGGKGKGKGYNGGRGEGGGYG